MGYETVLDAIEQQGLSGPLLSDGQQMFRCPSHEDRKPSASLQEGSDGRALVFCHAGCDVEDMVSELGLEMKDLFEERRVTEATYEYVDENGELLYRVVRFRPKGFTQERWEQDHFTPGLESVKRVLYRLPELREAQEVYLVEGEKDVERLRTLGVTATCNVGGAGKWKPEWSESLRGKDVIVVPDNDGPGIKHANAVRIALDGVSRSVRVAYPASGKDVSDHLDAGYTLPQLRGEPNADDTFEPLDWETYEAPETEWLYHPYIPTRGRVLVFGKAGSLKSLWVMWIATKLARNGKRVAYFSLEMRPEQTVARLRKLAPPKENFKVFTNYKMGDPDYRRRTIEALKGFDLIVVDSWNAAYRFGSSKGSHDDQVAELDDEFFQPIIDGTGATLVIIDNTGHDVVVGFGNKVQSQHARGSSAKGDKMDVTIFLTRPDEGNNYLTEVHVKKMRYDIPIPSKRLVVAPSDHDGIEFFNANALGEAGDSAWDVEDEVIEHVSDCSEDQGVEGQPLGHGDQGLEEMGRRVGKVLSRQPEADGEVPLNVSDDREVNQGAQGDSTRPTPGSGQRQGMVEDVQRSGEADHRGADVEVFVDAMSNGETTETEEAGGSGNGDPDGRSESGLAEIRERIAPSQGPEGVSVDVPNDEGTDGRRAEGIRRERQLGRMERAVEEGPIVEAEATEMGAAVQVDPFAGWKPMEKLAFMKAQRLFEELGHEDEA